MPRIPQVALLRAYLFLPHHTPPFLELVDPGATWGQLAGVWYCEYIQKTPDPYTSNRESEQSARRRV